MNSEEECLQMPVWARAYSGRRIPCTVHRSTINEKHPVCWCVNLNGARRKRWPREILSRPTGSGNCCMTAGTVNEPDLTREQILEPGLQYRMRLPPADLHQGPGPCHTTADGGRDGKSRRPVPVLVNVLHGGDSPDSASSSMRRRSARRRRSASSRM